MVSVGIGLVNEKLNCVEMCPENRVFPGGAKKGTNAKLKKLQWLRGCLFVIK